MDHAHLGGSVHLWGRQWFPLHLLTVSQIKLNVCVLLNDRKPVPTRFALNGEISKPHL